MFKLQNFESPVGYFGNYRWTVDEPEDFEVVSQIYSHFISTDLKDRFTYKDILDFMKDHPKIAEVNIKYTRNEGLEKSIREDHVVNINNQ